MDRHITITKNGYVDSLPLASSSPDGIRRGTRRATLAHIYDLAVQYGWEIRVQGQRWS